MRIAALLVLSGLAFCVGVALGEVPRPETFAFVLLELRLPRAVLGALVGLALGLVGALFQILFENPLATPSTVGTTAGASLGALAVILLGFSGSMAGLPLVALGAFAGAGLVTAGILGLAAWRRLSIADLLLLGIAISLGASAVSLGLQVQADGQQLQRAVRWALGSLSTVGWWTPGLLSVPVLLTSAGLMALARPLQVVAAGSERAAAQGVDLRSLRILVLSGGSFLVGCCVAAAGPIAFVGLLVPHVVRAVVGAAPRRLLPLSAVTGAGLLPLADGLARVVIPGQDLPVGVLTAAIGAPLLVGLLVIGRGRR